jgi:hypothetical protein
VISLSCWKRLRDVNRWFRGHSGEAPVIVHSAARALPAKAAATLIAEQIDALRAVTDLIQQSFLLTAKSTNLFSSSALVTPKRKLTAVIAPLVRNLDFFAWMRKRTGRLKCVLKCVCFSGGDRGKLNKLIGSG